MAAALMRLRAGDSAARTGRRRRPGPALWALAVLAAAAVRADCPTEPARIVELDLLGCRPAAVALDEQVAGSTVWWLGEYLSSIARQVPGVLVRGAVGRWRRFEPPQTVGPWQPGGADEEYFFPSLDPEFCATFEPLESVLLVTDLPCCEIIPPVDVACLLQLPQARSPTPLERRLAETASEPE